ncbi:peptide-methionine (S)-S-oxide reductase MsrA [Streptomyces sp. NPDC050988]|uniref:peptide-methionine (S)-S-oxide reductase MsrA n=1 Tax=Streptomyces sp. NPDC050988 TaxID=3365637 RepID=UPI00378EDA18
MFLHGRTPRLPTPEQALRGRTEPTYSIPERHAVLGNPLLGPYPEGLEIADFGLGCLWGAERKFWQLPAGVHTTLVGYQGGFTEHPTYEEVSSGLTGHTERVRVVYDPAVISYESLLKLFWESRNPTQGFRQGNGVGTQYRSAIHTHTPTQAATAESSRTAYHPAGYCGIGGTGVSCPLGVAKADG